jgi:hypothetical protein
MHPQDIRMAIDNYYNELDEALIVNNFILNKNIEIINEKIDELRENCEHQFKEGICIYCDLPEEYK